MKFYDMYQNIISVENLIDAWKEFLNGKRSREDVQMFEWDLMCNLVDLQLDLKSKTYSHGGYQAFDISDTKPRCIHKATVRDRLLHHAIYRVLYPYFDTKFIYDSYSCRLGKGTHKEMGRFRNFYLKASRNNIRTVWVLKCDIKKFFASIDHEVLFNILGKRGIVGDTLWLLKQVVQSFHSGTVGRGLPLGNLTSQLLVNLYMNEFDQFVKHKLRVKYYIRYADDFVILSQNKEYLVGLLQEISSFLGSELKLELHPNKVSIKTFFSGVDFLGWVHFPDHRVIRTVTKRRMLRNLLDKEWNKESLESYRGLLSHGNTNTLLQHINEKFSIAEFLLE